MNRFTGFVKKEFLHIFRDPRTMVILFGMPIAQILIFGFVITNEIRDAKIGVLDLSRDNVTREITEKLLSSGYFILSEQLSHPDQIEEGLKADKFKEVVVFSPDFASSLKREGHAEVQLVADASDANTASIIMNYTRSIIQSYNSNLNVATSGNVRVIPMMRMFYNPNLEGAYMFVPGTIALILMLVSAMMTSISITREKEMGTMEVLLVSPLRPIQIVVGKVTPYVVLSFINAVVIILMGYFVFQLPVKGSLVLLLAESLLFIMMALSLGILISTMSSSQQVAMFISMFALLLPTMLLSGFIFPIENMPEILQWISTLMPPRWFIVIIKNIMIKGTGLFFIWKETLILTAMLVIFITLSVHKFKIRLE